MSSGRILVIDDDDMIRATVAEALELDGFAVDTAGNGADALEIVRHGAPSGILLDLLMPEMTGWQFLERCRADALCPDTPVVVMSAYSELPDEAAARLGVTECVAKPFDLDELLGTIERAVRETT